mmetsp:Transcript_22992/g.38478  ORF Transcript_22992/g.38478 Transcript_22992/m.38478 type:complete len:282 (-) Transcript_22992:3720-4565(-)
MVTPGASHAPRDCPAWPFSFRVMVESGRPSSPHRLETMWERVVPIARSVFLTVASKYTGMGLASWPGIVGVGSKAAVHALMKVWSRVMSSMWSCFSVQYMACPGAPMSFAGYRIWERSISRSLLAEMTFWSGMSRSARPTISFMLRMPSEAMILRHSSATKKKKFTTASGSPANFSRRSGSCVAMPTGHVFLWHLRIMMQPRVIRGAVANPNSSAPSSAAMATSRPVLSWPSVCSVVRVRKLLAMRVWWVSERPSSQGSPQPLTPVHLAAPVPPSWPAMST